MIETDVTAVERWRNEIMLTCVRARLLSEQSTMLAARARAHVKQSKWWIARARRSSRPRLATPAVLRSLPTASRPR